MARWKKWVALVGTFMVVFPLFAWGLTYAVTHYRDSIAPSPAVLATPFVLATTVALAMAARTLWLRFRRVVLDDGGVRIRGLGKHRYLPFASIRDVRVRQGAFGAAVLEVVTDAGRTEVFTLPPNMRETLDTLFQRVSARASARPDVARLGRVQRSFDDWVSSLDRIAGATTDGGYREAAMDPATLLTTLRDHACGADLRGAAAYLLVASRVEEHVGAVREVLDGDPPPLLVAMAALAAEKGGLGLVLPANLDAALRYLDEEDREAVQARLGSPDRGRVRIAAQGEAGAEEAEALAEAEAEAEAEAAVRGTATKG